MNLDAVRAVFELAPRTTLDKATAAGRLGIEA
jgi:hypothetical protein